MPLLQYLQFGEIGAHGHTIGEVSRIMYRSHYDFRYVIPQFKWLFFDQATAQSDFVQQHLVDDWTALDSSLEATWRLVTGAPVTLA